jgi:hypothetical protein
MKRLQRLCIIGTVFLITPLAISGSKAKVDSKLTQVRKVGASCLASAKAQECLNGVVASSVKFWPEECLLVDSSPKTACNNAKGISRKRFFEYIFNPKKVVLGVAVAGFPNKDSYLSLLKSCFSSDLSSSPSAAISGSRVHFNPANGDFYCEFTKVSGDWRFTGLFISAE